MVYQDFLTNNKKLLSIHMTIQISDYKSRWDYMADRAGVNKVPELNAVKTKFFIVGRFVADWSEEVDYILTSCSGGRGFNFLNKLGNNKLPYTYELDKFDMISSGFDPNITFVNKIGSDKMNEIIKTGRIPILKKMIDWFEFKEKVLVKIHVQKPGQIFPFHFDDLTTHRNNSLEATEIDESPNSFARVEIQLKSWDYGHVWAIGNNYWSNWRAGEIMWHPWYDVPHGTANCGRSLRINMQITGGTTTELLEKLKQDNGDIVL